MANELDGFHGSNLGVRLLKIFSIQGTGFICRLTLQRFQNENQNVIVFK